MDGLPVTEANTCDYVSTHPGKMHACGHDGHMAMLLSFSEYIDTVKELDHNVPVSYTHLLKFILFIDDLSFNGNDDNFSALKATLEGSISGCGDNVAIYATSNRRHLVKETFSDRTGDELHVNDTLQETMSPVSYTHLTPEA